MPLFALLIEIQAGVGMLALSVADPARSPPPCRSCAARDRHRPDTSGGRDSASVRRGVLRRRAEGTMHTAVKTSRNAPCSARSVDPWADVLVVEDNPDLRDLIVLLLEDEGYTAESAGDGADALRLLAGYRVE